jgi:hypothetical protein
MRLPALISGTTRQCSSPVRNPFLLFISLAPKYHILIFGHSQTRGESRPQAVVSFPSLGLSPQTVPGGSRAICVLTPTQQVHINVEKTIHCPTDIGSGLIELQTPTTGDTFDSTRSSICKEDQDDPVVGHLPRKS